MPGEGVREGLAWRGGVQASVSGQQANFVVSKRVQKEEKWRFLKDALWGGGGYPPELAWWTDSRGHGANLRFLRSAMQVSLEGGLKGDLKGYASKGA